MVAMIGITRVLNLAGITDYAWVQEVHLFRGSEVARICELAAKGTLDRRAVPKNLKGYLKARDAFVRETGFVSTCVEKNVQSEKLHVRGRIDGAGLMHGKPAVIDYKTGSLRAAVALQLVLGGRLLDATKWFLRFAVQLCPDGRYKVKAFPLMEYGSDLQTAECCVKKARGLASDADELRILQWKQKYGLV